MTIINPLLSDLNKMLILFVTSSVSTVHKIQESKIRNI